MNTLDTLIFSCRLMFSTFEIAAWLWAAALLFTSLVVLGRFWGLAWNREWSIFGHPFVSFINLLIAGLISTGALAWFGADLTAHWLGSQKEHLAHEIASSSVFNREVLRTAWEKLQPLGGQPEDHPAPAAGGTDVRLNNENDAKLLALAAAENVKRHLQTQEPFAQGIPCQPRDPATVAENAASAVHNVSYPVDVGAGNEWVKQAVTEEVGSAMDATSKMLALPDADLKAQIFWAAAILFVIQLLFVPFAAVADIKTHPNP